jgi:hypothetical protein
VKYFIRKRYSQKFAWYLEVIAVSNRSLILLHPANNALLELNGCIAPVSKISKQGLELMSRKAFSGLNDLVYPVLEKDEKVVLTITTKRI